MEATARIFLQKARSKQTTEGLCPVKLVVTHNRKRRYYSLRSKLRPEWEYLSERDFERATAKRPQGSYKDVAAKFDRIERRASDVIEKMEFFSFDRFEREFFNKRTDWDSVYHAFESHIETLKNEGRAGYARSFNDCYQSIKKYQNNKDLTFHDITPGWLRNYETWMLRKGKSRATTGVYTRTLRRLFNLAIKEYGVKAEYPFNHYSPVKATANKRALNPSQISQIMNYEAKEGTTKQFARDMFLFSFFANGMNPSDIFRLKYKNIKDDEIIFVREKTKGKRTEIKIQVPLVETLQDIIDRWGQRAITNDVYIFPVLDGDMDEERKKAVITLQTRRINNHLAIIAKDLEFGHLSTVYARHSYATILKNSGASVEYIQDALGHSDVSVTQNYLSSFEKDTRIERAKELEQTIKDQKTG